MTRFLDNTSVHSSSNSIPRSDMRKTVFVVVTFFMLFFFMQQVLNPIWISLNSQVSASKSFNSTGRFLRYLKLQKELNKDIIDVDGDERDDVPTGNGHDSIADKASRIKSQQKNEEYTVEYPKEHEIINDKNDDNYDEEDEISENERLSKSPYIVHEDEEEEL